MNAIETEMHFLLICPTFTYLRRQFLTPYFCRWPTVQTFETLMTTTSPKTFSNLAKYIFHAFDHLLLHQLSFNLAHILF